MVDRWQRERTRRPADEHRMGNVISDCQTLGVAPFFKQWGAVANNPLVAEQRIAPKAATLADPHGKGGGLVDGRLYRYFPNPRGLLTAAAWRMPDNTPALVA
jgi:hypothetical protein